MPFRGKASGRVATSRFKAGRFQMEPPVLFHFRKQRLYEYIIIRLLLQGFSLLNRVFIAFF